MASDTLLTRLKDASPDGPLDRLAAVIVDAQLARRPDEVWPQAEAVQLTRRALDAWLESPTGTAGLTRLVEQLSAHLTRDQRALKDVVPRDVRQAVRDVVRRPFSPDRKVVLAIIDREPTRELVRGLLLDAVLDFGRKMSAPVAGVTRGLGALARMAGGAVSSRSGALGGLVGAVSGEVERQLEKRAVEFVDSALAGVFAQIADVLSDPRRASEAAELRVAVLDGALELTLPQLSRELINADVTGAVGVLRTGLERWLASAGSDADLSQLADAVAQTVGERPLRELLEEAGVLETARTLLREQLLAQLKHLSAQPAFADWLKGVSA